MGLVFSSPLGPMKGISEDMHERTSIAPDLVAQLADRLEERQGLDVADGAADLDDDQVGDLRIGERLDPSLISSVICGMTWTVLPR